MLSEGQKVEAVVPPTNAALPRIVNPVLEPFSELLSKSVPLTNLAQKHLDEFPFRAPANVKDSSIWYEGTFDPMGIHHLEILVKTMELGFPRATLGIVFQNPYKPLSTAFEHRAEMARIAIEAAGLTVVDDPRKDGVCIIKDEKHFHHHRHTALYSKSHYILIGADNFDSAYLRNTIWMHPEEVRENPAASERYGFRKLCEDVPGFRSRVLIYPVLHDVHATQIRQGLSPSLPPLRDYIEVSGIYTKSNHPTLPTIIPPVTKTASVLTREEAELRLTLKSDLSVGLESLRLLSPAVKHAVYSTVADFDHSEVIQLRSEMNKNSRAEGAVVVTPPAEPAKPNYSAAISTMRRLRENVFSALFEGRLETEGAEHVTEAHARGQKILFIGNHSGWADGALLAQGLRNNGLGAIAEGLTFMVDNSLFPNRFSRSFIANSFAKISTPDHFHPSSGEQAAPPPFFQAFQAAIQRLDENGSLVIYPEGQTSDNGVLLFSNAFVRFLSDQSLSNLGIDPESLVIIPWAQQGGASVAKGNARSFSEDNPALVRFGKPVPVSAISRIAESDHGTSVAAHIVGNMVAELIPPEYRGVYGPYASRYLASQLPRQRVTQEDLDAVTEAAELVKLMNV